MSLAGPGAPPAPDPGLLSLPDASLHVLFLPRDYGCTSAGQTTCQLRNSKTENTGMKKMLINLRDQTHMGGLWIVRATHSNPFQMGKSRQL